MWCQGSDLGWPLAWQVPLHTGLSPQPHVLPVLSHNNKLFNGVHPSLLPALHSAGRPGLNILWGGRSSEFSARLAIRKSRPIPGHAFRSQCPGHPRHSQAPAPSPGPGFQTPLRPLQKPRVRDMWEQKFWSYGLVFGECPRGEVGMFPLPPPNHPSL